MKTPRIEGLVSDVRHPATFPRFASLLCKDGKSGETVEILEHRSLDITCIIQETRFRGKSVRMINEKAAEYKLVWIGNEKG